MFFQEKCLFSIPIPFRTLCWLCFVQSLVCPYFGILAENPFPHGEGLCILCWLCVVQSLWAYTPGIRAGAECGAAALTKQGRLQSVAHSRWGYAPNPILISCISFSTDCLNTYLFSSAIILSTRAACLPPSNWVDRNTLTISSAVPGPITLPPMHRTFASL